MRFVLSLFLVVGITCAQAQQNEASMVFFQNLRDCATSLGGWKCLEMDLSSELTSETDSSKTYVYSWSFGDGSRINGEKVEHCYDAFGSYQVTMDLIDKETDGVIRNELSATVNLYAETFPAIQTRADNQPPGFMEFSSHFGDESVFFPDRVFWRIDGAHYQGRTIVHSFAVAGTYLVEMGVEKDTDLFGTISACTTKKIVIRNSDVWSSGISEYISSEQAELKTGPFSNQAVMCYIKSSDSVKDAPHIFPLSHLMGQVDLNEGDEYEVMLFSGNIFTARKKFSTYGLKGSDLYRVLKDTLSLFIGQPLSMIPPLRFETNEIDVKDTMALGKTAAVLLTNPSLEVEIGAYLHTGSRFPHGITTSLRRASSVKDALVRMGISATRISIASPENNKALMNSCSAMKDCEWENTEYDGKVEFKITGAAL